VKKLGECSNTGWTVCDDCGADMHESEWEAHSCSKKGKRSVDEKVDEIIKNQMNQDIKKGVWKVPEEKTKEDLLNNIHNKLKEQFPGEAYSTDSSRGFDLTSLKAQYIKERLNQVLTVAGWSITGEFKPHKDEGLVYFGELVVDYFLDGSLVQKVPTVGYCAFTTKTKDGPKPKLLGDVYKSAQTDFLSKAASFIGVGNDMFKGEVPPPKKGQPRKTTATKKPTDSGEYRIPFSKKFRNKTLKQVGREEILSFIQWLEESAVSQNKDLTPEVLELKEEVSKFFGDL